MNTIPSQEPDKAARSNRVVLWIALVWLILLLKSAILSYAIHHYNAPIGHIWIWAPSIIAAILISLLVWKK